jgi:hypothetical protein
MLDEAVSPLSQVIEALLVSDVVYESTAVSTSVECVA